MQKNSKEIALSLRVVEDYAEYFCVIYAIMTKIEAHAFMQAFIPTLMKKARERERMVLNNNNYHF